MKKTVLFLSLATALGTAQADWTDYVPDAIKSVLGMEKPKPVTPVRPAPQANPAQVAPDLMTGVGAPVVEPMPGQPNSLSDLNAKLASEQAPMAAPSGVPEVKVATAEQADAMGAKNLNKINAQSAPNLAAVSGMAVPQGPQGRLSVQRAPNPFTGKSESIEAKQRSLEEAQLHTRLLEEELKQVELEQELAYKPLLMKGDILSNLKDFPELSREVTGEPAPKKDADAPPKPKVVAPVIKKGSPVKTGGLTRLEPRQTQYDLEQEERRFKQAVANTPTPMPMPAARPSKEVKLTSILGDSQNRSVVFSVNGESNRAMIGDEVVPGVKLESIEKDSVRLSNGTSLKLGSVVGSYAIVDTMAATAGSGASGSQGRGQNASESQVRGGAIRGPRQPEPTAITQPVMAQPTVAQPMVRPTNTPPPPPPLPTSMR